MRVERRTLVLGTSVLVHLLVLVPLLARPRVNVRPMQLPGHAQGSVLSLVYLPASGVPQAAAHAPKAAPRVQRPERARPLLASMPALKPVATQPAGSGGPAVDALGEGDVTVALMQFFPDPKPDLSRLPHGAHGDVVLAAVIGADGRIAQLKLKQGVGYGVDEAVLAVVEQWTFHPATRDGKPVASEQELHFHYEHA